MQNQKTVKSPCKNICVLDQDNDYCIGCFRTIEEISKWQMLSYIDKERIIEQCKTREEQCNGYSKI